MGGGTSQNSLLNSQPEVSQYDVTAPIGDINQRESHGIWYHIHRLCERLGFSRRNSENQYNKVGLNPLRVNSYEPDGKLSTHPIQKMDTTVEFMDGQIPLTKVLRPQDNDNSTANVETFLNMPSTDINNPEQQQTTSINASGPEIPPLSVAIQKKNADLVDLLLKHGADVNQADSGLMTPLYHAVESGDVTMVTLLLNAAASLASDYIKEDPIHVACRHGYHGIVRLLVDAGAEVNPVKQSCVVHPLYMAIENKHEDICIYLIDILISQNMNIDGPLMKKAFIRAIWSGCTNVVKELLRHGSDVNMIAPPHHRLYPWEQDVNAIVQAIRYSDILRFSMDIRDFQREKQSKMISELRLNLTQSFEIVDLLLENGADPEHGMTVLMSKTLCHSLKAYNIPVTLLLLKHGALWTDNCTIQLASSHYGYRCSKIPRLSKYFHIFLSHHQIRVCMQRYHKEEIRSLQDCCRHVIRSSVRCHRNKSTSILPSLRSLKLPSRVVDYLCYFELDANLQDVIDLNVALLTM